MMICAFFTYVACTAPSATEANAEDARRRMIPVQQGNQANSTGSSQQNRNPPRTPQNTNHQSRPSAHPRPNDTQRPSIFEELRDIYNDVPELQEGLAQLQNLARRLGEEANRRYGHHHSHPHRNHHNPEDSSQSSPYITQATRASPPPIPIPITVTQAPRASRLSVQATQLPPASLLPILIPITVTRMI
ncbi:hypothetical protein QR680_003855 [Steinernema hermaphroditum]|uniref:Uncharacterized protein n=1 Tax=Steinernema hermaphroditum TaxID=289476 RepID=A0AA39HMV6_9BILA|nr:hypothetical protein QR680_003855 [Steinernema hermaphroditum]